LPVQAERTRPGTVKPGSVQEPCAPPLRVKIKEEMENKKARSCFRQRPRRATKSSGEKVYVTAFGRGGCCSSSSLKEWQTGRLRRRACTGPFRCGSRFSANGPLNRQRKESLRGLKIEEHRGSFLADDSSREHMCRRCTAAHCAPKSWVALEESYGRCYISRCEVVSACDSPVFDTQSSAWKAVSNGSSDGWCETD